MSEITQDEQNDIVRKKMVNLKKLQVTSMPPDSPYIRPVRLIYNQDGREKFWDMIRVHDSVSIIIFNVSRKKLVFVKQFRPPVYFAAVPENIEEVDVTKYPATLGLALELCAGMVDKNKSLVEIAREEVMEECGYDAPASTFERVCCYRSGVASASSSQTLFYVEVTDAMKTYPGGGADSEGELIEVIEMNVQDVQNYINSGDVQSPPNFLYGVAWFLSNKKEQYR